AARASSTVAPSKPCSSGRRASRSSSAARVNAVSTSAGRPRRVAAGAPGSRRRRSENHPAPSPQGGSKRTPSPEHSTVTSSHKSPQPAQVTGPNSGTGEHRVGERGQQARPQAGELGRSPGGRDQSAYRRTSPDGLAGMGDVAHQGRRPPAG